MQIIFAAILSFWIFSVTIFSYRYWNHCREVNQLIHLQKGEEFDESNEKN